MFVLVSYKAGTLTVDQHQEFLHAKEQMDTEFEAVLGTELEGMTPTVSERSDFDAELGFDGPGHWVWHIEDIS